MPAITKDFSIFYSPEETAATELPLFKEYKIENEIQGKQPVYKDNEIITLEGQEALKIWIYRVLKSERNRYAIHSDSYGSDLWEHIGTVYNKTIKEAMIQQEIIDCLMVNPYIVLVYDFSFDYSEEKRCPTVEFSVDTIYGTLNKQGVELIGL